MTVGLDFHLDGLKPADAESEETQRRIWLDDLTVLGEHHTRPYGSHSFVVAHDRSATWGVPGEPQLVAIAVARNLSQGTFTYEAAHHPTLAFAQNWLAVRRCPQERIGQVSGGLMTPADDLSTRIEQNIRQSGTRYEVLESFTWDNDPAEIWTLVHDSHAEQDPIRVFLEQVDFDSHTYTVREGAFADEDAAQKWLERRCSPLPEPAESRREAAVLQSPAVAAWAADGLLPGVLDSATAPAALPTPAARTARGQR